MATEQVNTELLKALKAVTREFKDVIKEVEDSTGEKIDPFGSWALSLKQAKQAIKNAK